MTGNKIENFNEVKKILIVGATGFIGSNIAKYLLSKNYLVFATYRTTSLFDKCNEFAHQIHWINIDLPQWKQQVKIISPDQLILTAWSGINSNQRNNWDIQICNFWFTKEIFDLAKDCHIKKVISFGSQAEYGKLDCAANEVTIPNPNDAYGSIKYLCTNYLRTIFQNSDTHWYWLRVFSIFGEHDNPNWLIPSVIAKLIKNEPIQLTPCEQRYNYMYIGDLVYQIIHLIEHKDNSSGIYNICNNKSIVLKDFLLQISEIIGASNKLLMFGKLPYRDGQNMIIDGNNSKFVNTFKIPENAFEKLTDGLIKTISFYKKKSNDIP